MARVMIVDDDGNMVSLLKTLLEMDGYQVSHVAHKDAILPAIEQERPEVVLMDIFLADVDGVDLLRRLRSSPELKHVRVIMTSGMDLEDRCKEAGADGFLLKPYSPDQLISLIQENLGEGGPR